MTSAPLELTKFVLSETIGSALRFPLWWYTDGLMKFASWVVRELEYRWKAYSFAIWIRNMFVPMYGQYDWSGRLVSFIMRLVVLVGRGIAIVVEAFAYLLLSIMYVLALPTAIIMIIYSFLV
jgi:hypothetical protein